MNLIWLRMKLTVALLVVFLLQANAKSFSQKVSFSGKNVTLEAVFSSIEDQTGYVFFYDYTVIKDARPVTLHERNSSLEQLLQHCFTNQDLKFVIQGKTILVARKDDPVPAGETVVAAEDAAPADVRGHVTTEKGEPIPNATVSIRGSRQITQTDSNGDFTLRNVESGATILVSSVGYESKAVELKGRKMVNIILKVAVSSLDQSVVIAYGTQKNSNITGSVSTVGGEVLDNRPITNVGRGLQGELPGLNVTSPSGQPGAATTFNVRGFASINGGAPYLLVDGIPADINDINPADIASVTVLKDAASAAVYGARAPFGVVLITTKSGKATKNGSPKVEYSNNYAIHKITNLPYVVTDPGTVVDYKNQSYAGYYGVNEYNSYYVNYAQQRSKDPSMPAVIPDPNNPTTGYLYVGNTNWFDELYKPNNLSFSHNISVSGAGDKLTYYFSGGYNQQTGVFSSHPDVYNRYNLRAKFSYKVKDWLTLYNNSAYNRTVYDFPTLWTSDWTTGDLYHQIGRANSLSTVKNPDGSWTSSGVDIGFLGQGGRGSMTGNEIQNTIGFTTSFLKNTLRVKGDYSFQTNNNFTHMYQVAVPYEQGPDATVYMAGHSNASDSSDNVSFQNINLYAEYERTFGKHYLKALAGYNQELYKFDYYSAENDDLISNSVGYLNQTTGLHPEVSAKAYEWALRGSFFRLNYSYNNRYLLELDGRYDGSSRFPQNNQYAFFPSASAGWKISEESWFDGLKDIVNMLKVRASYGKLGNDQLANNYAFIPTLSAGQVGSILGGVQPTAVYPPDLVSPTLKWESIYSRNLGVDFTVVKKLTGSFDIYRRDTKNMITYGPTLPSVLGQSQPLENAANLKTMGWELSLAYGDQFKLAGKPFRWSFNVKLWDNQSVITKYNNPNKFWFGGDYYVGEHVGDIWGMKTLGIFQTDAEGKAWADQSKFAGYYKQNVAGELKYADYEHNGKITYGDGTVGNPGSAKVIGNTTPRYSFGTGGNVSWGNFDLSFFFQGVLKENFWPQTTGYYWGMFFAPWENVYKNIINNTWTPQNPKAFFPSLKGWRAGDAGNWVDLAVPQTRYLYSAAYVRLKNLSIGYTVAPAQLKRIGIEKLRFYVSGEDLWEFDKLPQGFDPEGLGGSWGPGKIYPFQRSYSMGVNLTF